MDASEREAKRWLRELRNRSHLSQRALGELVGVDRRTILNAESEGDDAGWPHGFTLLRILQELGAVREAPAPSDSPLARLEEKVDESLSGIADVLDLLREAPGESGEDAGEALPP